MECTIQEYRGRVYAVHAVDRWADPVRDYLWWELATDVGVFDVGASAFWDSHLNVFQVASNRPGERTRPVAPRNRSRDAQADRVVSEMILPPRTRLPVRYRDGRWERQTARGWK